MTEEKKSQIIGISVMIIIILGIGIMLIVSKKMNINNNKNDNNSSTTTTTTSTTTTTTTKKVDDTSSFRMVIEDIFTLSDGITIDGKISQGTIHQGDKIEILGNNKIISAVADKIYISRKEVDSATKDDYISIHIKDINKSQVSRGQTIASPNTIKATNKFKANIYINTLKEGGNNTPIYNNYSSSFIFNIESYNGKIILGNNTDVINPGESKEASIELNTTVALEKDMTFIIKENGREIGKGVITEPIN